MALGGGGIFSDSVPVTSSCFFAIGALYESVLLIGVNLFFMISGFYQIKLRWNKLIKLILELYVYSAIIIAIGFINGTYVSFALAAKDWLLCIHSYWFLEVYFVITLISPMINQILDGLNNDSLSYCIAISYVVLCGYAFITNSSYLGVSRGYSLVFAAFLYILGGSISKGIIKTKRGNAIWIMVICIALNACLFTVVTISGAYNILKILTGYNNPLLVSICICIMIIFKGLNMPKGNKLERSIAFFERSTFGVYIIHSTNKVITVFRNQPLSYLVSINCWPIAHFKKKCAMRHEIV